MLNISIVDSYKFFGALLSDHTSIKCLPEILSSAGEYDHLAVSKLMDNAVDELEKIYKV